MIRRNEMNKKELKRLKLIKHLIKIKLDKDLSLDMDYFDPEDVAYNIGRISAFEETIKIIDKIIDKE